MHTVPLKRPRLLEDFQDSLVCLLCADYYSPPVIQCVKGHSYCTPCVAKLGSKLDSELKVCPLCKGSVKPDIRNYVLESMLEKCLVPCKWRRRGCEELLALSVRLEHEQHCAHRPQVPCYFQLLTECGWRGSGEELLEHLKAVHEIQELTRTSLFRYLWTPPAEEIWRFRYRILNQSVGSDSEPYRFVLEHFYSNDKKLLVFLVRSCRADVKKKYRVSIVNRHDESNRISFEGWTVDYEEAGHIGRFLETDMSKLLIVPYQQLKKFCFYCEEDRIEYFSLHVQFV